MAEREETGGYLPSGSAILVLVLSFDYPCFKFNNLLEYFYFALQFTTLVVIVSTYDIVLTSSRVLDLL